MIVKEIAFGVLLTDDHGNLVKGIDKEDIERLMEDGLLVTCPSVGVDNLKMQYVLGFSLIPSVNDKPDKVHERFDMLIVDSQLANNVIRIIDKEPNYVFMAGQMHN